MDIFPATVRLADADEGPRGLLSRLRVTVRGDRLVVLSEATGRIEKIRDEAVIDYQPITTSWGAVGYRIDTAGGPIEAAQEGGCGCGSRLKNARVEDYL